MKKIFFTLIFYAATMVTPAFSIDLNSSDSELTDNMIGDWHCEYVTPANGIEVLGKSRETFTKDGNAFSHNLIIIRFTALTENMANEALLGKTLELDITESYQWQVKNQRLVRTIGEITLNGVSDPAIAKLLGVERWDLAKGAEDAEFVEVSKRRIKLKKPDRDEFVTCRRQDNVI